MIHYLHDSILYDTEENTLFYVSEKSKKKIISNNWHKYLNTIGWTKLPLNLIRFLNRNSEKKYKNSPYGVIDCGGDGECLFHCISHALSSEFTDYYDYQDIRRMVAESIDDEIFKNIIKTYRILKDSDDFDEDWDPHEIVSKEQLQDLIKDGGHNYWGDHILFQLMIKALDLNIFIFKTDTINEECGIYPTYQEYNPKIKSLILFYEDNIHFKLVGFFKDNMRTIFKDEDIPSEIKRIYSLI